MKHKRKILYILSVAVLIGLFSVIGVRLLNKSDAATIGAVIMPGKVVDNTGVTPIYRFYRFAGGHFFTSNKAESDYIRINSSKTYRYENVGFYAYSSQVSGSTPVYRFYHLQNGTHFYTANTSEYLNVLNNLKAAYRYEGIAYYAKQSSETRLTPLYRFYNYRVGLHFYTINTSEKTYLQTNVTNIYRYEGVTAYLPDSTGGGVSNSMYMSPALGSYAAGTTFNVTVRANASDAVNAVQSSITYDPAKLQYVSMQNSGDFPFVAANSTTSGQVRVSRGTNTGTTIQGDRAVVTLTFKMLATGGAASLRIDPDYSMMVKASDTSDILGTVYTSDFWVE